MKKLVSVISVLSLVVCLSVPVLATDNLSKESSEMIITEDTTLGELIEVTNPETYYSFTEKEREYLNSMNLIDLEENGKDSFETKSQTRGWTPSFAAAISSDVSSPRRAELSYSASLSASQACPTLYLAATASEALTGKIVSSMGNTRNNSKQVTVANRRGNLISGRRYKVYFYGVVTAPYGLVPPTGVVTSTKYINLK